MAKYFWHISIGEQITNMFAIYENAITFEYDSYSDYAY